MRLYCLPVGAVCKSKTVELGEPPMLHGTLWHGLRVLPVVVGSTQARGKSAVCLGLRYSYAASHNTTHSRKRVLWRQE